MNMSPEELQILIEQAIDKNSIISWWTYLLFVLLPFLGAFFGSYSKAKGKNLATKEDVEEITEKIESIKTSHTKEIEKFKSEVLFEKDQKKQYSDRKEELLIKYYDQVTEFRYEFLAVNFGDFPNDEGKSLYEYQANFNRSVTEIMKCYQRLVVYITPGSPILYHAEQLVYSVLDAREVLKKRFGAIKHSSIKEREAFLSGVPEKIDTAIDATNEANKIFWDDMKLTTDTFKDYYQKFIADLNEYVKPNDEA